MVENLCVSFVHLRYEQTLINSKVYVKEKYIFGLHFFVECIWVHKVKFALEQAGKAQRGCRGIALLFL